MSGPSSWPGGLIVIDSGNAMSERPATCVRLLVEGRAQLQFFQVLLIATDSFDAARLAARRFLEVNGAQLVSFDEEETAIIQTGGVQEEFFFPVPTPEGVIGATAPTWVDPSI